MTEPQVDFDEPDKNQLVTIVEESNLPQSKAKYILERFQDYFTFADEMTKTTLQIKVTDASQTHIMDMARAARLSIRERRIAVEKAHKEIKADVLREGRAIDGIKNVLLALLEPLEVYYDKQENFVKHQEDAKAEVIRIEVEKKMAEKEAADARAKEQEDRRIREENESLRQEAIQKEQELAEERRRVAYEQEKIKKENDRKVEEERIKRQKELEVVRKQEAEKLAKERAERAAVEAELRAKKEAEAKAERDRIEEQERLAKAGDGEKLLILRKKLVAIEFPEVQSSYNKKILNDIKTHIGLAVFLIKADEENDI